MGLSPDSLIVTTGSQQCALPHPAIAWSIRATNRHRRRSQLFVYTGALDSLGANILTVPMDDNGMDVEAVAVLLKGLEAEGRLSRVKFVYCTSYYQNPTGLTLSAERRPRLLEIVKQFSKDHRILILEDAAYRELRYYGYLRPRLIGRSSHTMLDNQFTIPEPDVQQALRARNQVGLHHRAG